MDMDGPPAPLDPTLAPILLFGHAGVEPEDDARLVYSIPKKQLLLANGLGSLVDDVSWITAQGWVLTLDPATRDVSLRDPFSSRRVRLPPDPDGLLTSNETRCVMSTSQPTDPGCVVLLIHRNDPVLCYCRHGESRWFRHDYQPELLVDDDLNTKGRDRSTVVESVLSLVAAGNRFYAYLSCFGKLVTLEISRNAVLFSQTLDKPPLPPVCLCEKYCLVESCGELFNVQFYYSILSMETPLGLQVHKLDLRRDAWVKVPRLGINRVFVLSIDKYGNRDLFGASVAAGKYGLKANSIYFSNTYDKGLYVHDMERGTTTLIDPGPEIPDDMEPILLMPVI